VSVRRAQDERIEGTPDGLSAITEISDVPDAPTIGAATNVGTSRAYNNGSATVAYTSATTGGTPTTLTATSTPGSFTGTGSSPITVTGLQSATAYTFTVTPSNSTATGPASSSSSSITATTVPQAPTISTATKTGQTTATVAFTAAATGGSSITGYTATSSPGSVTGTGASSPISMTGLTAGTAYTFTVTATNTNGTSAASSASNSITTDAATIGLLGAWSSGTAISASDANAYWGWNLISGTTPRVYHSGYGRNTDVYYNDGRGGSWTTSASHPQGGLLGPSSRTYTGVSNRFYTYGADTGSQTSCYSTQNGTSWRTESSNSYNAGWGTGTYFTNGGTNYLLSVGDYPSGTPASIATIASDGTVSFSSYASYPVYKAAGAAQRLTSKAVVMGGYTSGLAGTQDVVYTTTGGGSWTNETALPNATGVPITWQLTGPGDSRIYFWNGTTLYSRGDSSGTWRTETSPTNGGTGGWGTVDSSGTMYIQLTSGKYQLVS